MAWLIIIGLLILFVILGVTGTKKQKENEQKLVAMGYSIESKIITGKYMCGHPDLNDNILKTLIFPKDGKLEIMSEEPMALPVKKAEIIKDLIKNVIVEDQSTVERRVTVGRLLTVGVFAFAWKKKKKNEIAYLTIEWNDGRFEHETVFEYEGKNAMQLANTARNQIIKCVK